jgi:hypothetical protein
MVSFPVVYVLFCSTVVICAWFHREINSWSSDSEDMVFGVAILSVLAAIVATAVWPPLCLIGFLSIVLLLAIGGAYDK